MVVPRWSHDFTGLENPADWVMISGEAGDVSYSRVVDDGDDDCDDDLMIAASMKLMMTTMMMMTLLMTTVTTTATATVTVTMRMNRWWISITSPSSAARLRKRLPGLGRKPRC